MKDKKKNKDVSMQQESMDDSILNNPFYSKKEDIPEAVPQNESVNVAEDVEAQADQVVKESNDAEKKKLVEELEKLNSQYVRLAADFDNYRKRQDQERQDLVKYSSASLIKDLLPALDSFDKAFESFKDMDDPEKFKESFNVIYRQMQESLSRMQVSKIKTAGELFDPNFHEAVMQEETTEFPDNAIMMELQCGYMVKDRVVRPSMVKVASNSSGEVLDS
ncbi:MAG: nucleotide exchange factor GrpE [Vampirovibrionia bacterium]